MSCIMRGLVAALLLIGLSPGSRLGAADPPREIAGWGTVTDPLGDCTLKEEYGGVTVTVPASVHDLWHGQTDPDRRLAAPRVLRKIEGDFVLSVKVSADWEPGPKIESAPNPPYNGAGLLIWDTDQHFLRWERNLMTGHPRLGRYSLMTPVYDQGGKHVNAMRRPLKELWRGNVTWLRLTRAGQEVTSELSHDGSTWIQTEKLTTEFPAEVQVGILVINGSDREFTVEFQDLVLEDK